jgi:hypothetical protein
MQKYLDETRQTLERNLGMHPLIRSIKLTCYLKINHRRISPLKKPDEITG